MTLNTPVSVSRFARDSGEDLQANVLPPTGWKGQAWQFSKLEEGGDKHINLPWNAQSFVVQDQRFTCCYLDRPDNPKPARFSERDYGRFGSYFEYDLTEDNPLELNYRIWLQNGEMTVEQVNEIHRAFVLPPTIEIETASTN